jgi:hypothetical protein
MSVLIETLVAGEKLTFKKHEPPWANPVAEQVDVLGTPSNACATKSGDPVIANTKPEAAAPSLVMRKTAPV